MLLPPPPGSAFSTKNHDSESCDRVITSQAIHATPPPALTASTTSRTLRRMLDSRGVVAGSSARPISSSTVDTTSTVSCVKARSGADSAMKVVDTTSPTAPTSTTDSNRSWWVSTSRAPTASNSSHTTTARVGAGTSARSPAVSTGAPGCTNGQAAATMATATVHAACRCHEPVSSKAISRRAPFNSASIAA